MTSSMDASSAARVSPTSTSTACLAGAADDVTPEVAAGIVQHLEDDQWFHRTAAFMETASLLAKAVDESVPQEIEIRPGFVGHLLTELLLDAALIQREPKKLDAYYEALAHVDAQRIQQTVNRMARVPAQRLAEFIGLFRREQFLRCYLEDGRLLRRVNHVLCRVGLPELPGGFRGRLAPLRAIVAERVDALMGAT